MRAQPASWDPAIVDSMPMMPPRRTQLCTFRRTYSIATLSANTGDTVNAFYIALNNMPNYTEFTLLFDQYRILEAVYTFTPYSTSSTSASPSTTFPGIIGSWIDYDDANLPANLQEGQQYESFQRNTATVPFVRIVKPRSAVAAYSGTFTSYQNVYGHWVDAASPAVQFYGLKTVITGSSFATSTKIYEVEATVTLQVRSLH
jgi:hypothetical protein